MPADAGKRDGALIQVFPRRQEGRIVHRSWELDLAGARRHLPRNGMDSKRLWKEASDMARHFSRWVLTVQRGGRRVTCPACEGLLVFDRGLRCVGCGREADKAARRTTLAWFGLMPPIGIDGLRRIRGDLIKTPPKRHVVGKRDGIGTFLLTPLLAAYPDNFPRSGVLVYYLPEFFKIRGIPPPTASHEYHMFDKGQMCLFAAGQWRAETTCREVLQQRAYAHVIKLLNYANGKRDAFGIVS